MSHIDQLTQDRETRHFNLSASKLANALTQAMSLEDVSEEKKLYAESLLLVVAGNSIAMMAEAQKGFDDARYFSPASSMGRVGQDERALYSLIDNGDAQAVGTIARPQTVTLTAHPNFSRSPEMVKDCDAIAGVLGNLTKTQRLYIEKNNTLPPEILTQLQPQLRELKNDLKPRKKRTREDELKETTLDMIPKIMEGASEQLAIFKKQKAILLQGEQHASNKVSQLDAVAKLMPEFNSWFTDGDGKPTCHIYDAELAIPAIKKKTYQEYRALLEKIPGGAVQNFDVEKWKATLDEHIAILGEVETLAAARMHALNDMHDKKSLKEDPADTEAQKVYDTAKELSKTAGEAYKAKLFETLPGHGGVDGRNFRVRDLLKQDIAVPLKNALGKGLETTSQNSAQHIAEDLYVKLAAYGNYAVHLQRRENAAKYRSIFKYLIQNNTTICSQLANAMEKTNDNFKLCLNDHEFFSQAVEKFASSLTSNPADDILKKAIFNSYLSLANKLEATKKGNGTPDSEHIVVEPLEPREMTTLDGLGYMHIAKLYPEIFKGGFVIAEFGQPDDKVARSGDDKAIKADVARLAKTEMQLHIAYAEAMDAGRSSIIPLHEDPVTMNNIPAAQEALRKDPVIAAYFKKFLGLDGGTNPESIARRFIDEKGLPQFLTAYSCLREIGCTDDEMTSKGLNIEKLEKTLVLQGPPDMEACSDNSKRASTIGATVAEHSVREKALEMAKYPITMDGQDYMISKPKYFGQGGAIVRATAIPYDSVQATWQGEHATGLTGRKIGQTMYNFMLGRLLQTQEAARGHGASVELKTLARTHIGHVGNSLGLTRAPMKPEWLKSMNQAVDARFGSTRDDIKRYDKFLEDYSEPTLNNSARPDNKSGGAQSFSSIRAIGLGAKEAGIFANLVGLAALFDYTADNSFTPTQESVDRIKEWKNNDPSLQQAFSGAVITLNLVNLKEKWLRGDVTFHPHENPKEIILEKDGVKAKLTDLLAAYDARQSSYKVAGSDVEFTAADLVMAHLTRQALQLEKALVMVYSDKGKTIQTLFDPSQQKEIEKYKEKFDRLLTKLRETRPVPDKKGVITKSQDRELLEGAYYILLESGETIFPHPALLEQRLAKDVSARASASN